MQRPVVTIPLSLMRQTEVDWDIDWGGQSAVQNIEGNSSIVVIGFPRWSTPLSLELNRSLIGTWKAHRWNAQGRVGLYRIHMVDPAVVAPEVLAAALSAEQAASFSNGAEFSDGSAFHPGPYARVEEAAAKGASSILISVDQEAFVPNLGQICSCEDWPFGVTRITSEGDAFRLEFEMPLRESVPVGGAVSLIGTGLFEAVDDAAGRAPYGKNLIARPQMRLREVLNR